MKKCCQIFQWGYLYELENSCHYFRKQIESSEIDIVEYAVYQGENFLFIGTAQECANKLNIKVDSVRWMATPTGRRRFESRKNKERAKRIIRLERE